MSRQTALARRPAIVLDENPETTGAWRWIVERSSMSNNDEVVLHMDRDITYEEFSDSDVKRRLSGPFESPKLVLSRPVFVVEVAAGLDVTYRGTRYDEGAPRITRTLDGLHRFVRDVQWRMRVFREESRTVDRIIADVVAYSYYDCMSGGMDRTCALACRAVILRYGCNLDEPVYPGREGSARGGEYRGWYTLGDWMRETEREGEDERFLEEVGPLLGPIVGALPPKGQTPVAAASKVADEDDWRAWADKNFGS